MSTIDMTRGNPVRLMLKFAFPVILTNLGQQLYMIVDAAIVGRGVGVDALAAVGCTDWTYWIILMSMQVMTQGFATFVSRYYGSRDDRMLNQTITMSALLSVIIAAVFTIAGVALAKPVLMALDTPANILKDATTYLTTMAAGTIIVTGYNLTASILRAFGDSKSPLWAMIIAALMNIALDLLFVMGFGWGVFGAAIASVLSQLFSFLFCLARIRRIDCVHLDRDAWKINPELLRSLLLFGLPLAIQYTVINTSGLFVQSVINLQGSGFVAGYTAVNKLYGILECSAIALGAAFTTFASQNYGARLYKRVRASVRTCNLMAIGGAIAVMLPLLALRGILPQLFLNVEEAGAAEAIAVAKRFLTNMAAALPFLYMIYVYRSHLQSIGDSIWSMISGFVETFARIGMVKLVIIWLGSDVLFYTEPVSWIASLLSVLIPYYFYRRKRLPMEDGAPL